MSPKTRPAPRAPRLRQLSRVLAPLLLTAFLVALLPSTAQAGTLTGVSHDPFGDDELYSTQPTERSPRDPMAGQLVTVKATTWPISSGQTVWVTWTRNGVPQTPIGAAYDYNSGNNTYWRLDLGTFARGDQITYNVNADVDGSGTKTTGPFSFSVTSWSGPGNVTGWTDNGGSVDIATTDTAGSYSPKIRFAFPAPDRFHTQVAPKGAGLNITGASGHTVTDNGTTITIATSGMQLKIQKTPYRVSVFKSDGTTLIARQYDPATFRNTGWASDGINYISKVEDHWAMNSGERFEGFGERYDRLDQRGTDVNNYVYNQYQDQGVTRRTYLSKPFFTSSTGYGVYLPSTRYSIFNVGTFRADMNGFTLDTAGAPGGTMDYHFFTGSRAEILDDYTATSGRPALPPKWAFGLWMSANEWNTQGEVEAELAKVTANQIPHSALVLEQWSDEATFYLWHGAQYTPKPGGQTHRLTDLTFPAGTAWRDPKAMVNAAHAQDIKVLLWQIPVLKENFSTNPSSPPQQHLNDRAYAASQGYLLGNGAGGQYRIPSGQWFGDSTVPDFTGTAARNWWTRKRQYLFDDIGIDGFKTDGSEAVFGRDVTAADGRTGAELHNAYPNEYLDTYDDFTDLNTAGGGVIFSRAGTSGAQTSSIFWAGDQASSFGAFQEAVRAGLSAGQSGVPFWAWDMAGFTGNFPSSELYLRSAAQATFSPIMQYHSEKSDPSVSEARTPWNVQARTGDQTVIPVFRKFANIRMNLLPYIYTEARQANQTGMPLMQAMSVAYPNDAAAVPLDQQYMFGRNLLVAPITAQGATSKSVYLPAGDWYDLWNGGRASGAGTKTYVAATDTIPVYARAGAILPLNLGVDYRLGSTVSNDVDTYTNLVLRVYPSGTTSYAYFEDQANQIRTITSTEAWSSHRVTVSLPPLTTTSTLQVASSAPTGVTRSGTALPIRSSKADLSANAEGWYWDPIEQLTHVKIASSGSTRSIVLNGVDQPGYEAEFGTGVGTSTNTNHAGYTGTGFVDSFDAVGDAVSVDVSTTSGSHVIKLRYANATGTTATRTVQVDGATVGTVSLPALPSWSTWGTASVTVNMTAGKHTVRTSYGGSNTGSVNLDNVSVVRP